MTAVSPTDVARGDGEDATDFVETLCRVTKDSVGGRAGELIVLRPWQKQIIAHLLARREDGLYRNRQALIGVARKNGKSALGAALAIYSLVCGPEGAEVYSCAGDRDQARIVFGVAKRMIELEPELADLCRLYRDAITVPSTGSVYRVLSAEAYTKEGLNPTMVIFDEVHVQPNREFWDVMSLAAGARVEPLMVGITTAGVRYDSLGGDSLCYSLYEHGKRVCKGEIDDPTYFMGWWEPADSTADHRDPDTWREANPGYGDLVSAEDFAASVLRTPEPEFRTKRVNQWITSKMAWLPAGAWEALDEGVIPNGKDVVLGFDGSFNGDCTALVAVSVAAIPHVEVVACWDRPAEQGDAWQVPILDVEDEIRQACRKWQVKEIACDPFRWARTYQILEGEGLPIVEFPQAQPLDEPVLTPTGWTKLGDLLPGDDVIGSDGRPTTIIAVHDRGIKPVYEVTTTDRGTTRCTGDHLWLTVTPVERYRGHPGYVRTLDEIAALGLHNKAGRMSLRFLPVVRAVEHVEADLPIDPYVLGVLLGDGNFTGRATPRFTSADQEIVDRVAERVPFGITVTPQGKSKVHFALSSGAGCRANPLTTTLRALGLYGLRGEDKHVPAAYLFGSPRQRLDLLRGLMDTDGTASGGKASFYTTAPSLRDGLVDLVRSLGGSARYSEKPLSGKMRRRAWIVSIHMPVGLNPFALQRKADILDAAPRRRVGPFRAIASIEPLGDMPVRCITVVNADGLYVTRDYIVTHNSPARMTPATTRFYEAVVNRSITRSNDARLARHIGNAYLRADSRGTRIFKEHRNSTRHIDLAVASVMALERACWWHSNGMPAPFFASWR